MAFVELLGDINKEHRQCTAVGRNPIINAFILSIAWHITNNSIKKKKLLKLFKKKSRLFFLIIIIYSSLIIKVRFVN